MLFPLFGINATVNNSRITAIIGEDTKQEIKEKVSCFFCTHFAYFRLYHGRKHRRKIGGIHATHERVCRGAIERVDVRKRRTAEFVSY